MIKAINAVVFSLLLIFFSVGLWLNWPSLPKQSVDAILKGEAASVAEEQIEQQLPLRQSIIEMWAKARFQLFGEGNAGVLIGENGWLFSREEFLWPVDASDRLTKNMALLSQFDALLKENNVQLYIVLLPLKAEVYSQYSPYLSAQIQNRLRESVYNELRASHHSVLDGYKVLSVASSKETVFLKTDTHWSWQGASLIAEALASQFGHLQQGSQFERVLSAPQKRLGDLTTFIPAGEDWLLSELGGDVVSVPTTSLVQDDLTDLFGNESDTELALVGTSYSADPKWDFIGALQLALNTEIVNYAAEGEGPFVPMLRFIEDEVLPQSGIRHVIWEVPVRYMIQEPGVTKASIQELGRKI